MSILRRRVALAAVLALVATACGDDASTSRPGPTAPPGCGLEALAGASEPVDVTVWHFFAGLGNGAASRAFADTVDRFNRSQQKVRVEAKGFGSPQELVGKYYAIPPGGRGAPDLVHLPPPGTRAAADTGRVVPVQACLDAAGTDLSDFVPSALAATRSEGTQWGLPDGYLADLLLYDTGAFVRAGLDPDRPPATLAELRTAAERLRAAGVKRPIARLDTFLVLESSGVQVADADNGHGGPGRRAVFDTPDAREIVRSVQGLLDDELLFPADPKGTWADDLRAIGRGEAAMTMHNALDLKDVSNALSQGQAPGFRLGVAAGPTLYGPGRSMFTSGSLLLRMGRAWPGGPQHGRSWSGSNRPSSRLAGTPPARTSRRAAPQSPTPW
ncbi:MAG: extracellular solute-binding protein [Acidimicrobiales bacterium]